MNIRVVMTVIAGASLASVAAAQSGKDEQPPKVSQSVGQPPVIMASASDVRRPSPADANRVAERARRPAPRVTTCRCGGQQPQPDEDPQPDE